MDVKQYSQMMEWLTRPPSQVQEPRIMELAEGGRIGFKKGRGVPSETSKELKNFVEKFKLENNRLPTQDEIFKGTGRASKTIKSYLVEGVDFKKLATKKEAAIKGGTQSGIVRAVPEGQDPSYVKRAKTLDEASKFLSKQDAADFKQINAGKKAINNYFKSKPELINTTDFGKNIKALLSLRMDKETGNIFSKVRPDSYYIEKAKEGKLFDIFDIRAVKEGGRNLRFPTNINITPSQFNQVFIQNQAGKFFAKGINEEALKNVENILKEKNIKVKLPNVGYVGADEAVAVTGPKGKRTFPKITKTLESMKAPKEILKFYNPLISLGCPGKAAGGRISFDIGGSTACISRALEKLKNPTNLGPTELANIQKLRDMSKGAKGARTLGQVGRLIGKLGLGTEVVLGGLFALSDYASGANKEEIISNFTYGLAGKSMKEQLTEKDPLYGRTAELMRDFTSFNKMVKRHEAPPVGRMGLRPGNLQKARIRLKEKMQPFMEGPRNEKFSFDMFATQELKDAQAEIAFAQAKEETKKERQASGILAADDWYLNIDKGRDYGGQSPYAEGGIVSLNVKK